MPGSGLVFERSAGDTCVLTRGSNSIAIAIAAVSLWCGSALMDRGRDADRRVAMALIATIPQRMGLVVAPDHLSRRCGPIRTTRCLSAAVRAHGRWLFHGRGMRTRLLLLITPASLPLVRFRPNPAIRISRPLLPATTPSITSFGETSALGGTSTSRPPSSATCHSLTLAGRSRYQPFR
jgi:hypothetical protein